MNLLSVTYVSNNRYLKTKYFVEVYLLLNCYLGIAKRRRFYAQPSCHSGSRYVASEWHLPCIAQWRAVGGGMAGSQTIH